VIIDGDNLRFALYKWCPGLNHCFGGDYDKYYRYVKQFFSHLLSCGVIPSIVCDGGYDKSDQKLATVMNRLSDQTKNAVACNSVSQSKLQVFPCFGKDVFMEVLKDLDIDVRQCSYEADEVIAQLAMKEKCPVISNDSDFYIFNVKFISLDSLDLESLGQVKSINCKLFNREKMLSYYGLYSLDLLHLFASLMGNDYIPPQVFEKIFINIKLPKKTKDASERHRKIKGLLLYLSKERCAKQALNKLLGYFLENERKKLKEKVLHSVNIYNGAIVCDIVSTEFSSHENQPLPPWFVSEYHSAYLPNWLLSVVANRKYFLPTMVEQKDKPSIHLDFAEIHQVLINILTSVDENCDSVKVYARIKSSFNLCLSLKPDINSKDINLNELRSSSVEERRNILKKILAPNMLEEDLSNVPDNLQLFTMVLDYWSQKSKISNVEIQSVLLCHFALTQIDPKTGAMRNSKKLQEIAQDDVSENKEYFKAASKISSFYHIDEGMKTSTRKFDIEVVHSLSKLQALTYVTTAINRLLGNIFSFPNISDVFNGTFIFNIIMLFSKVPYKKEFLPPLVSEPFNKLSGQVSKCLTNLSTQTSKLSPKKKLKKLVKASESDPELILPVEKMKTFHDVENIFSALSLE